MEDRATLERIISEVLKNMGENTNSPKCNTCNAETLSVNDYPLASKRPELVKTPTNKTLNDLTLDGVMSGEVTAKDVRITKETLELQAQIAESAGRKAFAMNLRRAAELTIIPDERVLQIYNSLRPYKSTKQELIDIADELLNKYNAKINSDFIREAAEVYEQRKRLKGD